MSEKISLDSSEIKDMYLGHIMQTFARTFA